MDGMARRVNFVFLCVVPFLTAALVAARALRISGVYQTTGGVLFAAILTAAWNLGWRTTDTRAQGGQTLALAGGLLIAPFAIISLLWVGLGTPWDARPAENEMRYLVLLTGAIAIAIGFIVLKDALNEAGERFYSTLGFAQSLFAGATYLVWTSCEVGTYLVMQRDGQLPAAIVSLRDVFDVLLFVGCVLTYLATAAFAMALRQAGWLGQGATRAYLIVSLLALLLIVIRGVSFPNPTAGSTTWYALPGFVAGIPAVPWIMPFLIGVILLRRAGDERATTQVA